MTSPKTARVMPPDVPVRIVRRHHALVRVSHWLNVPLLLLLIGSGLSIHWAAPVFVHAVDPVTRSKDVVGDLGVALDRVIPTAGASRDWIYDHLGFGTRNLAQVLSLHWLLAYLFMANGLLYAIGLLAGGGWRVLVPRLSDPSGAIAMMRYYLGVVPMAILRRPWPHPPVKGPYNALQRGGYFTVIVAGALVVLSGWAMHKPSQLGWLERLFIDYNGARVVHFACMVVFALFVVPHVILVILDGFDTFRSMVTGWSKRVKEDSHGEV